MLTDQLEKLADCGNIERITFDLRTPGRLTWRVEADGEEVVIAPIDVQAGIRGLADALDATRIMVNNEFGILDPAVIANFPGHFN